MLKLSLAGALVWVALASPVSATAVRSPAVCNPAQSPQVAATVRQPRPYNGIVHFGVELSVSALTERCVPAFSVSVDGRPMAPPDGIGATEFQSVGASDPRACIARRKLVGDILRTGEHEVEIRTGCLPGSPVDLDQTPDISLDFRAGS